MADIHKINDITQLNRHETHRLYNEQFSNRLFACYPTIASLDRSLRKTVSFAIFNADEELPRAVHSTEKEKYLLENFQ